MNVLSVAQAADALDVSRRRVRQLPESGQLAGQQLGRSWVIDRIVLDDCAVRGGVSAAHEQRVDLIVQDAAEVHVRAGDVGDLVDSLPSTTTQIVAM
jgi:excisionase family DNA binding protein